MMWLAGQVFLLCLLSFLAGAAITALALRRKSEPVAAEAGPELEPEPADEPEIEPEIEIVKATKKSMRYHTPDSPYYNRVKGDLIFSSVQEAEKAGYSPWNTPKTPAKTS
jgi:hypothetical protein